MIDVDIVMENLIEISNNKSLILDEIYFLTIDQSKIIVKEDIDELNNLIDKKQVLIDKSKKLDAEFEKIVDELKLVFGVDKLEDIDICKTQIEKIQIVINAIMSKVRLIRQLELDNSTLLRDMKDSIEKKIKAIKVGKKAVSNYGYAKMQQPVYFNKKH